VSISHGVVPRSELTDKEGRADDLSIYKVCDPGDVVINRMSAYQGAVGICRETGVVSPDYLVLRPLPTVEGRFLAHLFKSTWFVGEMTARLRGIGSTEQGNVRTPRINPEDLGNIEVRLPRILAQQRIANYLDRETARMDALIAARRLLIAVSEERVRLRAHDLTMTDGEAIPLRRLVSVVKTGTTPPADALAYLNDGTVPWYSPGDVTQWLGLSEPERTLKTEAIVERWVPEFPPQSTLIVGIGATAGKIAYLDHAGSGNQQMTCLVPRPRVLPRFLSWQLFARRDEIRSTAPFTTLPIISNEFIKSLSLLVPSLFRQREIVSRLDCESARAQALRDRSERQVALLTERRQAIITAAVTGQLDIGAAA
jgi:type I restriction enzyme S subunit